MLRVLALLSLLPVLQVQANACSSIAPRGWTTADAIDGVGNETFLLDMGASLVDSGLSAVGYDIVTADGIWWGGVDAWGRFIPDAVAFPSTRDTHTFNPVTDKFHSMGLKFAVWIPRGVPALAVRAKSPILGTAYTADQIVDRSQDCTWLPADNFTYGVNASHPGAAAYYDSVAQLYAQWGLDLVKADCFFGEPEYNGEVALFAEAMTKAQMQRPARPLMLSWSPGNNGTVAQAEWAVANGLAGTIYRITGDVWDYWWHLERAFDRAPYFAHLIGMNASFPDLDILPVGVGYNSSAPHPSSLTRDEQYTLMNLWCMFRSPLLIGGMLPTDEFTVQLLTNPNLLAVNAASFNNRQVWQTPDGRQRVWAALPCASQGDRVTEVYAGLFNLANDTTTRRTWAPSAHSAVSQSTHVRAGLSHDCADLVVADFSALGLTVAPFLRYAVRDLWQQRIIGIYSLSYSVVLPCHASQMVHISMVME